MDKKRLGRDAAFHMEEKYVGNSSMSKRFYAACAAMQGILSSWNSNISFPDMAKDQPKEQLINTAYVYADELLKQEKE